MDGKFNPYRAGQPLSGNGNPNTGVWQRTWEDAGPGRPSHVVNTTSGGVADWSGKKWKPEAPGLGNRLARSLPSTETLTNALLYGHVTTSDDEPTDDQTSQGIEDWKNWVRETKKGGDNTITKGDTTAKGDPTANPAKSKAGANKSKAGANLARVSNLKEGWK